MSDVLRELDAQIEHYGAGMLLATAKEGFDTGKAATEQAMGEAGQASTGFQPRAPKSYCAGGDWRATRSPSEIEEIQALAKKHDVPEEEAAGWYDNNTQLKNLDKQAAEYGLTGSNA